MVNRMKRSLPFNNNSFVSLNHQSLVAFLASAPIDTQSQLLVKLASWFIIAFWSRSTLLPASHILYFNREAIVSAARCDSKS